MKRRQKSIQNIEFSPETISHIDNLAKMMARQIDQEIFAGKYAPVKEILKIVGAGAFIGASVIFPTLPIALKPFLSKNKEYYSWKRFNIPYLKRSLERLERQKLVRFGEKNGVQSVEITNVGRRRILRYSLEKLTLVKPKNWDGKWRIISYDIPDSHKDQRTVFKRYLNQLYFYPFQESVALHAYPCAKEIVFIREYLGIAKYVRICIVDKIENDELFKEFFDL